MLLSSPRLPVGHAFQCSTILVRLGQVLVQFTRLHSKLFWIVVKLGIYTNLTRYVNVIAINKIIKTK